MKRNISLRGIGMVVFMLVVSNLSFAKDIYVNDGSLTGDVYCTTTGTVAGAGTKSSPYSTLKAAITASISGDFIYVDAGNYIEKSLSAKSGVSIIGAGPSKTTFIGSGSYLIYFMKINSINNFLLSNLNFKDYKNEQSGEGEAVTITSSSGITLRNVTFSTNKGTAGEFAVSVGSNSLNILFEGSSFSCQNTSVSAGGIAINGSNISININNSLLSGNNNTNNTTNGSALNIKGVSNVTVSVSNCVFSENQSQYGGAIYIEGGGVSINQCKFLNNTTLNTSGTGGGGAIWIAKTSSLCSIIDCEFKDNISKTDGGAIQVYTGIGSANVKIENCLFENNKATVRGNDIHTRMRSNKPFNVIVNNCVFNSTGTNVYSGPAPFSPCEDGILNITNSGSPSIFEDIVASYNCKSKINIDNLPYSALPAITVPEYENCPNAFVCNPAVPGANQTVTCPSTTATLTATGPSGSVFYWYDVATGGAFLDTSSSATPDFIATGISSNKTYYVVSSLDGCENRIPITVTYNCASCTSTISYTSPSCNTGTISPTKNDASIGTYSCTVSSTGTLSDLVFSSTSTGMIDLAASKPGTYTIQFVVTADPTCKPTTTLTINPLPSASGVITGSATVCQGQTGVSYSVPAILNATSYTWAYSGTGATINGSGNSITIDFSSSATSGNLTVQGTNTCGAGNTLTFPITVNQLPSAASAISGAVSVCQNQTGVSYSVSNITNATSYIWSYSGVGASISGTTNPTTIDFSSNATSGTLTIKGTNSCGDGTASTLAITVNPIPNAAGSITGSGSACQGLLGANYSVPSILNAISYTWSYSGTGVVINGSGAAVTLDFSNSATSGTLTVKGTNTCGDGPSSSIAILINPLPLASGSISGVSPVCQGQTGSNYSVTNITNATSYTWSYSGTGATINGTTNPISIDFSNSATSGTLTVSGTNACGNGPVSANFAITVNPLPSASGSITGTTTVCQGQSGVSYSVSAISNATSYTWIYSGTGAVINGSGNSITIDFSSTATSGTLTVKGVNSCGEGVISAPLNIVVNPLPANAGVITGKSSVCQGSTGISYSVSAILNATSYTWSYSGTGATINVATNPVTIDFSNTATSGNLVVKGTNLCGSGALSANFAITILSNTINSSVITPISACGNADGQVSVTGSGTGTISWNGSTITGSSPAATALPYTITGLNAGSYSISFDNGTCITTSNISLSDPGAPIPVNKIDASGPTTFCQGGSVDLTATTAETLPYTYNWTKDGSVFGSTQKVTATTSGSYAVTITKAGCTSASFATTVTVTPLPSAPNGSPTAVYCSSELKHVSDLSPSGPDITWYNASSGVGVVLKTDLLTSTTYYASQKSLAGCESSARLSVSVTINPSPLSPIVTTVQTFCQSSSHIVSDLQPNGLGYTWYDASNVKLTGSDVLLSGQKYHVTLTSGLNCESSSSSDVTVTLTPTTPTPTGSSDQVFCATSSKQISDLVISKSSPTGTITWYSDLLKTTILPTNTLLVDQVTYFATQTVSSCESTGFLAVTVTLTPDPAAPTGSNKATFCSADPHTVANLTATGSSISWYSSTNSLLQPTDLLVTGTTYYATQKVSQCESSSKLSVLVTVIPTPSKPTTTNSTPILCASNSPKVSDLNTYVSASGAISWYNSSGVLVQGTDLLVSGASYFAENTLLGCKSTSRQQITVTINNPQTPILDNSFTYCASPSKTLGDLKFTNTQTLVFYPFSGGLAVSKSTVLVDGAKYKVSNIDNQLCESPKADLTISLDGGPNLPIGLKQTLCSIDKPDFDLLESKLITLPSGTVTWYSLGQKVLDKSTLLVTGKYDFNITDSKGCDSPVKSSVDVLVDAGTPLTVNPSFYLCKDKTYHISDLNSSVTNATPGTITWYGLDNANPSIYRIYTIDELVLLTQYYGTYKSNTSLCESNPKTVLNINYVDFTSPTVLTTSPQIFCKNSVTTLGDIDPSPYAKTDLIWTLETDNTPLPLSTPITNDIVLLASELKTVSGTTCVNPKGQLLTISKVQPIFTITDTYPTCNQKNGKLEVLNAPASYSYAWYRLPDETTILSTTSQLTSINEGEYRVVVTEHGCIKQQDHQITLCNDAAIPQILTPNNDGSNDKWIIGYYTKYPNVSVSIFNRWGAEVFKSSIPYKDDWDGIPNVGGTVGSSHLPTGTYYYVIDKGNGESVESGYIELVK